ncbi:MAG: hypothetical protein OEM02_07260 [Desulfobulbaceae bacterium]|nr:hypothetical protein [Desulfobulbaceae bacterium]
MVDIIVGAIPPAGPPIEKLPSGKGSGFIDGEILNVRQGRKRRSSPGQEERRKEFRCDPAASKVLTIMVGEGTKLPDDLDGRRYTVQLRFKKK